MKRTPDYHDDTIVFPMPSLMFLYKLPWAYRVGLEESSFREYGVVIAALSLVAGLDWRVEIECFVWFVGAVGGKRGAAAASVAVRLVVLVRVVTAHGHCCC